MSTDLITRYSAAFQAANGYLPEIEPNRDGGFAISTRTGSFDGYTAADVERLTRSIERRNWKRAA